MVWPDKSKAEFEELTAFERAGCAQLCVPGEEAAGRIVEAVAADRRIPVEVLLRPGRGPHTVVLARQVAMYLVHTLLGRRMEEVAYLFGRDRSTVAYACAVIEDRREEGELEETVARIEARLARPVPAPREMHHAAL